MNGHSNPGAAGTSRPIVWRLLRACLICVAGVPVLWVTFLMLTGLNPLSESELDVNSGRIRESEYFLGVIPTRRTIRETFLSSGYGPPRRADWRTFSSIYPSVRLLHRLRLGSLFYSLDSGRTKITPDARAKLRTVVLKLWRESRYPEADSFWNRLEYICYEREHVEGVLPVSIDSAMIASAAEADVWR
jgi:hypothetical protein